VVGTDLGQIIEANVLRRASHLLDDLLCFTRIPMRILSDLKTLLETGDLPG
jgi:hypothetical protein